MKLKKLIPNSLSLLRFVCSPLFLEALSSKQRYFAILIIAIAGVSDFLDGYLARRFDATSKFGELLDPLSDKIFCNSVLCGIYFLGHPPCPILLLSIAIPLMARDLCLILGSVFIRLKRMKVETKPVCLSKICTFLIFIFSISSVICSENNAFLMALGLACLILILLSTLIYFKRFSEASKE
jgi:cardiolipin synthase